MAGACPGAAQYSYNVTVYTGWSSVRNPSAKVYVELIGHISRFGPICVSDHFISKVRSYVIDIYQYLVLSMYVSNLLVLKLGCTNNGNVLNNQMLD